jgi:hypothetical protein
MLIHYPIGYPSDLSNLNRYRIRTGCKSRTRCQMTRVNHWFRCRMCWRTLIANHFPIPSQNWNRWIANHLGCSPMGFRNPIANNWEVNMIRWLMGCPSHFQTGLSPTPIRMIQRSMSLHWMGGFD